VDLGPEVMILTGSHEIDLEGEHIGGEGTAASVTIGNGCWLGARAMILPGVTLADKTLVAAGSVVTKSVDVPCSLVAGVPAEVKKRMG
jgi:maltose O-acetyltransferase